MKSHAFFLTLLLTPLAGYAQGPLNPPAGAPVPSMKTLDQIEARTAIESLPYTISTSGSYYLAKNLQFAATSGDAISITAPNVTLDLNGFTISGRQFLSGAPVQGHQVHHYCNSHGSMCIRGEWVSDVEFVGHWNDPRQGHSVTFTANLYSH